MRGTQWGQGYNRPTGCSAEKALHATFNFFLNKCKYQSITQQYLKRCLIKDANNHMYIFRPIAATIRFSSESMEVV